MEQDIIETVFTPYGDMYLKFASEQEAKEILYKEEFVPNWDMIIDFVGSIYKPTGREITLEDGTVTPEMSMVTGFHVNTRGEMPAELEAYRTNPVTPIRVWA